MRFYVSPDSIFPEKNIIEIKDREEIHHIKDVMRLKEGIEVTLFDGQGREYIGIIERIDGKLVSISIKKTQPSKKEVSFSITLYQSIPKKAKMDFIVAKGVELGVDRFVPMFTGRTIPGVSNPAKKIERWKKIARESSKQCGRLTLPAISDFMDFKEALVDAKKNDLVIFAALDKCSKPLKEILRDRTPKKVAIFIGPEGDFTQEETIMAKEEGYKISSLGHLVLRVETASLYALSSVRHEYSL